MVNNGVALACAKFALAASLFLVAGCREDPISLPNGPELQDSGIYVADPNYTRIFWIDDERLVFAGQGRNKPPSRASETDLPTDLYLWNLGSPPKAYPVKRWLPKYYLYCAFDGKIYYGVGEGVSSDVREWYAGPPGKEELQRYQRWSLPDDRSVYPANDTLPPITGGQRCEHVSKPALKGRKWFRDDDATHILDAGPQDLSLALQAERDGKRLRLLDLKQQRQVDLPINLSDTRSPCILHDWVNDRFIVKRCRRGAESTRTPNDCYKIWIVDEATNSTSDVCIDMGDWSGSLNQIVPTRNSLFFVLYFRNRIAQRTKPRRGLYRYLNGELALVLPGVVRQPTVSPNGCKIAFHHYTKPTDLKLGRDGKPSTKVINVC